MRPTLTYANVMSTLAVFLVVSGGAAYAASHLRNNSVGPKQLKKNSVTTAKVKNRAITAAKIRNGSLVGSNIADQSLTGRQVNASTLGTVPTAQQANSLAPPEGWREVGSPGQPDFQNGWKDLPPEPGSQATVAFFKDHDGIVHLRGAAYGGTGQKVFALPPGYRPAGERELIVPGYCASTGAPCPVEIVGAGSETFAGAIVGPGGNSFLDLDSITFRAPEIPP
jgi:hypothetical protein